MNRSVKKSTTFKTRARDYSKKKPTKIFIDSSKNVNNIKEKLNEKQVQNTNVEDKKEEPLSLEDQKQKRDKIIHENNLKVMEILQKDLDKYEKESELLLEEMERMKKQEKDLKEEYEKIREDIEETKDELEELRDINDEKNREYIQLSHLRHRQIMDNPNNQSSDTDRSTNNNTNNQNEQSPLNRFTLGEVMDGLLRISGLRGEMGGRISNSPFIVFHSRENNDDGPPMSNSQIEALPSSSYPRKNNDNEKCTICEFVFCYNDIVTKLSKCSHTFHKNCLVNRLSARQSSKCPTCKVSII